MTIAGLTGSLLSHEALAAPLSGALAPLLAPHPSEDVRRAVRAWHVPLRSALGPTASARVVFDRIALPLAACLGFRSVVMNQPGSAPYALLQIGDGTCAAVLLATAWGEDAAGAWRDAIRRGIGHNIRWCLCVTGPAVRIFDATRTYSRRFAEFDLALAVDDERAFAIFWGLLRSGTPGLTRARLALDVAVEVCEQYRAVVRDSLKDGVYDALIHFGNAFLSSGRRRSERRAIEESLIVIYRVLFLLFAEARGLVPQWHPVYRNAYTVESLRASVEASDRPHGLWEALQAIARLAHRGCRAGTLRVPPFNGRLFSPADAPLADTLRLDDETVRRAMLALTTRRGKQGRERIAYADLGVEQLGAVYEHVLDFAPGRGQSDGAIRLIRSGRRKATGSFYTPRSLTEYLVRRTLAPLVEGASAEDILRLRILDPAMGSGAFLVAACRYLAVAYEQALVREGEIAATDTGDRDRTAFRRAVAQRCLFGVDINPMAVQLARLSLWLATLAGDRPLTFLDHHLRTGDSLVGASLEDIHRQPPAARDRTTRAGPLPLFAYDAFESGLRAIVPQRLALAEGADDTLEQVRQKERTLARITDEGGPLARWKMAADLWCSGWFSAGPTGRIFSALLHQIVEGDGALPAHTAAPLLQDARETAARGRFFHWTLEFPEAFYRDDGAPLDNAGFDAVVGNPPWEMLRSDRGDAGPHEARTLTRFARRSGIYPLQGNGHCNLYQLFIERALSLLKPNGRLGFIAPSGLATDHGSASLRRELLGRTTIDTFMTLENRDAIFPIHRGLKFMLFTLTAGGVTLALPARVGVRSIDVLDRLPDAGADPDVVTVPSSLLRRMGGDDLAIPEIRSSADLDLVSRITGSYPALGDADGWNVQFGRELNASDDRPHFVEGGSGLPVVEGKHLWPFRVDVRAARVRIAPDVAARILRAGQPFLRPRLAYRDVASATNRLTLIAAIVPAGVVTTHTLFCMKSPLDIESQHVLCAIFNSFVANYLVRMRVGTHVTASLIDRLPVPKPSRGSGTFLQLARLSRRLGEKDDDRARALVQAGAARLYGLTAEDFAHVLEGFPLVPRAERDAALSCFRYIVAPEPVTKM